MLGKEGRGKSREIASDTGKNRTEACVPLVGWYALRLRTRTLREK